MSALDNVSSQQFVNQVHKTGGASVHANSGKLLPPGKSGFMVGGTAPSMQVPSEEFGPEHVQKFAASLPADHSTYVGGWEHEGQVYLDASQKVSRAKQATRLGKNRNQISVWDNKNMKEIPTGGTGE